jgi:hypothetical protein
MGQGRKSRESEDRIDGPRTVGAIHIVPHAAGVVLYFPPLRAAGSALMLALFGGACSVIGLAAISGLVRSGETAAASMLALAFAGVFALPLLALGQLFIVIAIWTAANSLYLDVSSAGLRTIRKWFGYTIVQKVIARDDIAAIDSRFAAKYIGAFGSVRYYRLVARARDSEKPVLIADSLKGSDMVEEIRQLIVEHLGPPAVATSGWQAHLATEDPT